MNTLAQNLHPTEVVDPTIDITETSTVAIEPEHTSSAGIGALGINASGLTFQIINFIILFIILKKFVFKPIGKYLDERKQKIAQSLTDAEAIGKQRAEWEVKQKELLDEAINKSATIVSDAKKSADQIKEKLLAEAKSKQEEMIESAKKEIDNIQAQSLTEAKKQLADLAIELTRKITNNTIDPKINDDIVKKSIKDLT